jgi:hypothetical protein
MKKLSQIGSRIIFALTVFLVLAAAILTRPPKPLDEFDQPFYLTVAYDLIHHGVFSNGFINLGNAAGVTPSPGMFFGPLSVTHCRRDGDLCPLCQDGRLRGRDLPCKEVRH